MIATNPAFSRLATLCLAAPQDGDFVALDAKTWARLGRRFSVAPTPADQLSYPVNGKEYFIGTAAGTMYAFRYRTKWRSR